MSDRELLMCLNEKSQKIINDMYSIANYIDENKEHLKSPIIFPSNYEEELITYACFLATLNNKNDITDFFDEYVTDYETVSNLFDFDNKASIDDVEFTSALETNLITKIPLSKIIRKVLLKLKLTNYLENMEVDLKEIQDYQIFDYLTEDNRNCIFYLISDCIVEFDKNIETSLTKLLHSKYLKYIADHYNPTEEKEQRVYDFDHCQIMINDGKAYLIFKEDAVMVNEISHITKAITSLSSTSASSFEDILQSKYDFINKNTLPCVFQIKYINHQEPTEENIEQIIYKERVPNIIPFEITDTSGDTYVMWLSRINTFIKARELNMEIDEMLNNESLPFLEKVGTFKSNDFHTPYLDKYGFDLTKDKYIKDPSIGRDEEIKRIEQILLYPERDKSIIVTGVAGSGKTALVKGLAYRVQNGDVPKALKNLKIYSISSAVLVAGTKYVGTLEEKMKNILDEASQSKDILLFIDEIHQALGAGKSENDNTSVSEILKPYLDYGRVRVIGATTTDEYLEYVSSDEAFKTRFKRVNIKEPDNDITYQILDDLITSYNSLGNSNSPTSGLLVPSLEVTDEERDTIIRWLIDSTQEKYRTYDDRCSNPRLVLDIIKEAYAIAAFRDSNIVEIDDIKQALLLEERLYKYSREKQVENLKNYKPIKKRTNIYQLSLYKKED